MLLDRLHISIELETLSPLTVGTGGRAPRAKAGSNEEEGSILQIHRHDCGEPCIPATSLKGALRARMADKNAADELFGAINDQDDRGVTGRLMIYAAVLDSDASKPVKAVSSKGFSGKFEFERPATAIDRETGAVARNKLFSMRAVAPGCVFRCDLVLNGAYPAMNDPALEADIAKLGAALAALRSGLSVGKGSRLGGGRLVLRDTIAASLVRFDAKKGFVVETGDLAKRVLASATQAARSPGGTDLATLSFTIHAEEPFFLSDPNSSHIGSGTDNRIQLAALEDGKGRPVLWPTSLVGALRSRAAWLAEIDRLRNPEAAALTPASRKAEQPADDRDLTVVLGSRRAVAKKADIAKLSATERLFGVAGWRGLLNVRRLEIDPEHIGRSVQITSVKIDRLSGGALDQALFTTKAFVGAKFQVVIAVDATRRGEWVSENQVKKDLELLRRLAEDLQKNGLQLGHAAARGFGWCRIEDVKFGGALA